MKEITPETSLEEFESLLEFGFSNRVHNALNSLEIHTISQLTSLSEGDFLKAWGAGKVSLGEIKGKMSDFGLSFRDEPERENLYRSPGFIQKKIDANNKRINRAKEKNRYWRKLALKHGITL